MVAILTVLIGCGGSDGGSSAPQALATIKGKVVLRNNPNIVGSGVQVYIAGSAEVFGSAVVTGLDGTFSKSVNTGYNYKLQATTSNYLTYVTENINASSATVYDIGTVTMDYVGSPPPTPNL